MKNRFKNRFVMKPINGTDLEYRFDYDVRYYKSIVIAILARKESAEAQSKSFFLDMFGDVENTLKSIAI